MVETEVIANRIRVIKILLADNHVVFRRGFVSLLEAYPEFQVVGEVSDSIETLALVSQIRPDVLVVDYDLLDGNSRTKKVFRKILSESKALVLTGPERGDDFLNVLEAGARGYLSRDTSLEALIEAIKAVATGHVIVSADMARKIAGQLERNNGHTDEPDLLRLSGRQQEVVRLVAEGLTNKEIATSLFVSETTVKSHMRTIMEKFHAKNRSQVVVKASHANLLKVILPLSVITYYFSTACIAAWNF